MSQLLVLSSPADTNDVVWNFVVAELESPRWRARLDAALSPDTVRRLRSSSRGTVLPEDLAGARRALLAHRGRFVGFLLSASARWHVGRLQTSGVEQLRVIAEGDFVERAPTRLLGEFARKTDQGVRPILDFDTGYRTLRAQFDASLSRGTPIIVGERERGPYTIAEGLTRLTCLASLLREGSRVPHDLECLVGFSPELSSWGWA